MVRLKDAIFRSSKYIFKKSVNGLHSYTINQGIKFFFSLNLFLKLLEVGDKTNSEGAMFSEKNKQKIKMQRVRG